MNHNELKRRAKIVVEQCNGLVPYCEVFYVLSILYSASRCVEAFARYDAARTNPDAEEAAVSSVHEAMGHAAALSRFFWPSGLGKKDFSLLRAKRSERLRGAFKVDERSALRSRDLRDALEHFDERLDLYLLEQDAGYFFPSAILGDSGLADDPIGKVFKLVDPQREIFVVLGRKLPFGGIRREVERLHDTRRHHQTGGRLRGDA